MNPYRQSPVIKERDAVVSALVMAQDLLIQYEAVIVRLTKLVGTTKEDEFSLHIAEANRVFAGVWDQLDHARSLYASAEVETGEYDRIRAKEGVRAEFGILDSTTQSQFMPGALAVGVVGTLVTLGIVPNAEGAVAAKSGMDSLRKSMPDVNWSEEARAREQPHIELRSGKKSLVIFAVILGFALVLAFFVTCVYPVVTHD